MKNLGVQCFLYVSIVIFTVVTLSASDCIAGKKSVGVYIYENIEGYHQSAAVSGPAMFDSLKEMFGTVNFVDKVPLESNETARILEEMTEGRKVVVSNINTWLTGGVISSPTITFADDAIKFKDLTWHIDENKILEEAKAQKLTHVLIGTFTGKVKGSSTNGKTLAVNVSASLKLLSTTGSGVIWAKYYNDVKAGFDARVAFEDAAITISKQAGKDLSELDE